MQKIDTISFNNRSLEVYGTVDYPYFLAADVGNIIEYSDGKTGQMLEMVEPDECCKAVIKKGGQNRTVWMLTELGLYNILSQSRKPIARLWRRVVHEQLITIRRHKGLSITEQFEEWDDLLDTIYIDSETGILMQSITISGGDVEQIPYEKQ